MENHVGKILGKVTAEELKEIKNFTKEKTAVKRALADLFEKATELEAELEQHKGEWWIRIRQKYNLPKSKDLREDEVFGYKRTTTVSLETGELYIGIEK